MYCTWREARPVLSLGPQSIREILLVGHRQAFAWIDEWFGGTSTSTTPTSISTSPTSTFTSTSTSTSTCTCRDEPTGREGI